MHQGQQGEGCVPQPAETIVPIARATRPFRKRGCGSRHDPTRREISEGFQCDERPANCLVPRPTIATAPGPLAPVLFGLFECPFRIDRRRNRAVRGPVRQHERDRLSFAHGEFADGCEIFASQLRRSAKRDHVGSGNGAHGSVFEASDPGHRSTVVEPYREFHLHPDSAAFPSHQPDEVRMPAAERHEIDQGDGAVLGFKFGFKDESCIAITPDYPRDAIRRRQLPASVIRRSQ